jgi:hypothetical protein
MRTNVIDAFNLYYGCLKGTPYRWLDLAALCHRLLPNEEINRIRHFTALVRARPERPPRAAAPAHLSSRPGDHPEPEHPHRTLPEPPGPDAPRQPPTWRTCNPLR